jgi:hypothetical protein
MDDGIAFKVTPLKTAGMLLLLALIPLVAGYVRGHQVRADAVAFAADGVATTGKVLNKTSEFVRNSMRYTVYFEYKDPNGVTYQGERDTRFVELRRLPRRRSDQAHLPALSA